MNKNTTNSSNWWDKLGKPQYGGEIVIRASRDIENFDPYYSEALTSIYGGWMERLVADDWTVDPAEWDFSFPWHPSKYMKGQLAEGWEFPDPSTHVIHLRKGVHWQNIPPANGREFTADDAVLHYKRLFGMDGGITKGSPFRGDVQMQEISISALDKYTVVFKCKIPNPEFVMETLHGVMQSGCIASPDVVKKYGDATDWHHAVGTGPFILKDFTSGKSATLIKDNTYRGYDERFPQNKIPYVDAIKYVVITDNDEALAAMRAGKLDIIDRVSEEQMQSMKKTNSDILSIHNPTTQAYTIQPRNDHAPFNDIRVRKAMQMSIDLQEIAKKRYGGTVSPNPSTVWSSHLSKVMKGWGFPYEQWPQDLKAEYAYNPAAARQLLTEAGYPHGFKTNIVVDIGADQELFKYVIRYFSQVGIEMEIRPMESNACTAFVGDLKFDQLVYRQYGPFGHCYGPFQAVNRFHTGNNFMMVSDPIIDAFYPKALYAKSEDELRQACNDMNERVARQHFAVSLLQPNEYALYQPWLKGFHGQIHSIWMGIGGPSRLSFYGARFWIDHKLKKSLGK